MIDEIEKQTFDLNKDRDDRRFHILKFFSAIQSVVF